jgi:hypothetical protein
MPTPKADFTLDLLGLVIGADRELRDAKVTILDNLLAGARSLMDDMRTRTEAEPTPEAKPAPEPSPAATPSHTPTPAPTPTAEPDDLLSSAPRATRGRPRKARGTDAPQAEPAPVVEAAVEAAPEGDDLLAEPAPEAAAVAPEDQGEDFFNGLE